MTDLRRISPVRFDAQPMETTEREGWHVVLAYTDEGPGPYLVDLSHRRNWDVQHASLSTIRPWGLLFPEAPGQCRLDEGRLVHRMNYRQAAVWHLADDAPSPEPEPFFTDVTDGLCVLALVGPGVLGILERVTTLDLSPPDRPPPFLLQGPVLHIPCQVVVLASHGASEIVLLGFSRGYGQAMAEAILEAGHGLGLRPGGENAFRNAVHALPS